MSYYSPCDHSLKKPIQGGENGYPSKTTAENFLQSGIHISHTPTDL